MLKHYVSETTIHGIKDLYFSKHRFIKLIWAVLLVGAFVGLGTQIENIVEEYLEEPTSSVNTNIRFSGMMDILYCPKFWMNSTKVAQLRLTVDDLKYLASLSNMLHVFGPRLGDVLYGGDLNYRGLFLAHALYNSNDVKNLQASFLQKTVNFTTFHSLVSFLAVDWDDTLSYAHKIGNATPIVSTFGACVFFKYLQNVDDLMMDFLNYSFAFKNPDPHEIHVRDTDVLAFGDDIHTMRTGQFLTQPPNEAYEVDLVVSKAKRVPTRRSKCTDYSAMDYGKCFDACRAEIIETSTCHLIPSFVTKANLSGACSSMLPLGKFGTPTLATYADHIRPVYVKCAEACHQPCERWSNRATYLNLGYRDGVEIEKGSLGYSNYEFYVINAFDIQCVEEFRIYSPITLFSNLGGMTSLFCGASLLSVAQVLVCLANYVLKWACGHSAKSVDVEVAEVSAKKHELDAG